MTTALQAHLGQQLASGLDYLHKRRIIHRNICARHCYVSYGNTVKIGDLHLAREYADPVKFKDDRDEGRFSVKVSLCSLPQVSSMRSQFLAPELLQGDIKKFSTESDVWSFGMLLWEIVTRGTSPFLQVRTPPLHTAVAHLLHRSQIKSCWRSWRVVLAHQNLAAVKMRCCSLLALSIDLR